MIPTIEDILFGYEAGEYTLRQALHWINEHIRLSIAKPQESATCSK
jgi:hypothetical protein